jgi:translation initiation factor IF-2
MAKIRVYELARELNMTNKMLLSKLSDLDISVKSHMSSLDDETIARIKTIIFEGRNCRRNTRKTDCYSSTSQKGESRSRTGTSGSA